MKTPLQAALENFLRENNAELKTMVITPLGELIQIGNFSPWPVIVECVPKEPPPKQQG